MKIKNFLQLIRYKNLLFLILVQLLFSAMFVYAKTASFYNIDFIKLFLLIQTTTLLAAAGNVINDYFDVEADRINKPNKVIIGEFISGKNALLIYFALNFFGVISGVVLAYIHGKVFYGLLFVAISSGLYLYSKSYKKIAVLGNFIISVFVALSIYLIYLLPPFDNRFFDDYKQLKHAVFAYTIFAFLLNFIREIVKDLEDINGDYSQEIKTLPIIIGRKRTQNSLFYIASIPFLLSILLVSSLNNILIGIYFAVCILIPLGYFIYQIKEVKTKEQFHKLSTLLKFIMLFGILSILLITTISN